MIPRRVVVEAPCKVNLDLRVLGRRPDGYHELDTVLVALDRCDRLALSWAGSRDAPPLSLEVRGAQVSEDVPLGPENLVWRAAERVLALAPEAVPGGLSLVLEKEIPSRAGLGGGSSDAAACVLGVATLLGLPPGDGRLHGLLAELGSDCPFFLEARETGLARCTGRGERVRPLPVLGPLPWAAVVTPSVECPTAEVYAALAAPPLGDGPAPPELSSIEYLTLLAGMGKPRNDLEPAALAAHPALLRVRRVLDQAAPRARLAGSGASWFVLERDEARARASLGRLHLALRAAGLGLRAGFVAPCRGSGVAVLGDSRA